MQARTRQTTQMLNYAMDASARMRILVSADERLHQPGCARKEKNLSFVIHSDTFLYGALL